MIKIDACGLSCPEPVYLLQKGLAQDNEIVLSVDNKTSLESCSRYALSKGLTVSVTSKGNVHELTIKKTV